MLMHVRRLAWAEATCFTIAAALTVNAQNSDKNSKDSKEREAQRPKLVLKAQPLISTAPARVVLTAELLGGAKDYEEYYCPTVEWEWGDGTKSESSVDCRPYEAGKSEIKRRFTVEHVFHQGNHRVTFRLKRQDKQLASAGVNLQVQPGLRDNG